MFDPYSAYMARVKRAAEHLQAKNEESFPGQAAKNVLYGMMSTRSAGPVGLIGSSMGGVIDAALMKPVLDAGIHALGRGVQWAYGHQNQSSASL